MAELPFLEVIMDLDSKNLTKEELQHCHDTYGRIKDIHDKAGEMRKLFHTPKKRNPGQNNKVNVFARVRPLSGDEEKISQSLIAGLVTKSTAPKGKGEKISAMETVGQGLEGLLGVDCNNIEAYKQTIGPNTDILLGGGIVSLFCYGHSGTGKTHTTLGYKDEPGLFKIGCGDMFQVIDKYNQAPGQDGMLMLEVRFTEVYLGRAYDLLNNRAELKLIEDENGEVHMRAQTERKEGDAVNRDQKFVMVKDLDHLLEVLKDGIALRAAGCSSIHDQSSRSHAVLEMRVTNEALVRVEEEEIIACSKLSPHDKRLTIFSKKLNFLGVKNKDWTPLSADDMEWMNDTKKDTGDIDGLGLIRKYWAQQFCRTCDTTKEDAIAWFTAEMGALVNVWKEYRDLHDRELWTPKGWMACFDYLMTEWEGASKGFLRDIPPILALRKKVEEIKARSPKICGGKLTLVDLAGADHDTRDLAKTTKQELRESAQINKELSTLKGVMSQKKRRKPWRDTKLTLVLKNVLEPPEGGNSQPIMVACVSPSITQERDTVNTLHYAQMVAGVTEKKTVTQNRAKNSRALDIQKQVRQIYAEHCPEKTVEQVDTILDKFKGREAELLQKVRRKYQMKKQQKPVEQKNENNDEDGKVSAIGQLLNCGSCATGKAD